MSSQSISASDSLHGVLDTLFVAQFELCGLDPHPTRTSLSEARFRQAREALAGGIASLQRILADESAAPTNIAPFPQPDEELRAAA